MSTPDDLSIQYGSIRVLELFAKANDVAFDPTRAKQAVRAATVEIPPTQARAARLRLIQAGQAIGLQFSTRQLSVREALRNVSRDTPLAVYTVTPDSHARWFVLDSASGRTAHLAVIEQVDEELTLPADDLAEILGAPNEDAVLEWLFARPTTRIGASVTSLTVQDMSAHHDVHHMPPFRRLIGLLRAEKKDIGLVFVFAIGVGLFTLATPIVAMAVVNTVAIGILVQQLLVLCVALFLALSVAAVLQFLQTMVVEFIQRRVFVRVAEDLAYRLPRVSLQAFDRQHGPELVNRFFDVLTVQKAAATLLLDGITIALQVIIGLILLGYYHTYLLGFDLILIASLIILFTLLGWGAVRLAVRESIAKYAVAGWMEEMARHPIAFKTAGGPQLAFDRVDVLTRHYLLTRGDHFWVLLRQMGFALFLQVAANVSLLAIGGWLVIQEKLTLGELVAAEIVVTLVVATFAKLGKQLEAYYDLLAAVDKLGHLIDLPLERSDGVRHQSHTGGISVSVRDLAYQYEGANKPALRPLNLSIEPGERIALTGPNGVGKSTLIELLFGLRQPKQGRVEIDGVDLRSLRLDTVREHVAMVHRIEVIEGSIYENIRMGRDTITLTEVLDALEKVGLREAVMAFPDGVQTRLWTGGSPLSLGQANRLMIARAIVGQPRLLILDESLDHMDQEIRDTVWPAILGPEPAWTVLVVTHSEEVAARCTRRIHLERGA